MSSGYATPDVFDYSQQNLPGVALVVATIDNTCVEVQLSDADQERVSQALIAIELNQPLDLGDQVLVIEGQGGNRFVIGVVSRRQPSTVRTTQLADGSAVKVDPTHSHVEIVSREDSAIVRYAGNENQLYVESPSTNVVVASSVSDLRLQSSGKIQLVSKEGVEIESQQVTVCAEQTNLQGGQLEAVHAKQRFVSQRIDFVCDKLISTVRNAFQFVSELFQVKAKRSRTIVDDTNESFATQMRMNATEDYKVNAKNIHLG